MFEVVLTLKNEIQTSKNFLIFFVIYQGDQLTFKPRAYSFLKKKINKTFQLLKFLLNNML